MRNVSLLLVPVLSSVSKSGISRCCLRFLVEIIYLTTLRVFSIIVFLLCLPEWTQYWFCSGWWMACILSFSRAKECETDIRSRVWERIRGRRRHRSFHVSNLYSLTLRALQYSEEIPLDPLVRHQ